MGRKRINVIEERGLRGTSIQIITRPGGEGKGGRKREKKKRSRKREGRSEGTHPLPAIMKGFATIATANLRGEGRKNVSEKKKRKGLVCAGKNVGL